MCDLELGIFGWLYIKTFRISGSLPCPIHPVFLFSLSFCSYILNYSFVAFAMCGPVLPQEVEARCYLSPCVSYYHLFPGFMEAFDFPDATSTRMSMRWSGLASSKWAFQDPQRSPHHGVVITPLSQTPKANGPAQPGLLVARPYPWNRKPCTLPSWVHQCPILWN